MLARHTLQHGVMCVCLLHDARGHSNVLKAGKAEELENARKRRTARKAMVMRPSPPGGHAHTQTCPGLEQTVACLRARRCRLDPRQACTPWVLCQVGRAFFEHMDYSKAAQAFERARKVRLLSPASRARPPSPCRAHVPCPPSCLGGIVARGLAWRAPCVRASPLFALSARSRASTAQRRALLGPHSATAPASSMCAWPPSLGRQCPSCLCRKHRRGGSIE